MRNMKDSGVDSIGFIPFEWTNTRLKYLCSITTGDSDTQDATPKGKYPFYVRSPIVERSDKFTFEGDGILIAGDGAGAGRIFHRVHGKYAVHQRVYRLYDFKNVNIDFIYHYLESLFPNEMGRGSAQSTVPSIRLPMLANLQVSLPPIEEQSLIVSFVSDKVDAITEAIARHQSIIEKLEEYKKSVITQAVTKGLNPNVEMKDSGVEWIGKIPEDWESMKNKYVFSIKKDIAGEEGHTVLSITQRGIVPKDIESNEGQIAASYANYQIVNIGDFAMNHMDLLTGWVDISKYEGVTSPDYRVFKINDDSKHFAPYYLYVMQLCYFNRIFYGLGAGVSGFGRWRLQAPEFKKFKVPVPPIDEQKEIAHYLDDKCLKISDAISRQKTAIDKLEEYKKSLIYNAVTGKIDCRNT